MTALQQYLQTLKSPTDKALAIYMNEIITDILPAAEVKISYGLMGYFQPKQICFFGINKQHVGFYPTNKPIQQFHDEIAPYLSGKTTLRFAKDETAIPKDLIQKIALWNLNN